MDRAALILVLMAALMISPAFGEVQVVRLWHYNVSLDTGSENVTVEPATVGSNMDVVTRTVVLRGDEPGSFAAAYLYADRSGRSVILEDRMWNLMHGMCKMVRINKGTFAGMSGLVGSGDARVEHGFGQKCYVGGGVIGNMGAGGDTYSLIVVGHFKNETANERIVKTAGIEYSADGA